MLDQQEMIQAELNELAPVSRSGGRGTSVGELSGPIFPVVGIGASAGGLKAVGQLVQSLPADIKMAFILVQHLAPEHKSMMSEILASKTSIAVSQATDGQSIEPGHLYVIPPNRNLGILNGTLQLMPRDHGSPHLPIDYLFQSLAADQGSNAIGIILSGSASDGTLGLRSIKAAGGITFAEDPEAAGYASMPKSAIASGCVDLILKPADIAVELVRISRQPGVTQLELAAHEADKAIIGGELEKIFLILRDRTGHDFSHYKTTSIQRRIARRMLVQKIERLKDYVRYLLANSAEVDALFDDILINVTRFFREPEVFHALKNKVFPEIMNGREHRQPVRIWVSGCSSGEEVYSIIIALIEFLGDRIDSTIIRVFATDIDEKAIASARGGIYPDTISADVSPERLQLFFTSVSRGYKIQKRIRDMCVFASHNIASDPPFLRQDLIACRNMMIYMNSTLQRSVLQRLHYSLNKDAHLLLGTAESVGKSADLFSVTDKDHKIFKKKDIFTTMQGSFTAANAVERVQTPQQDQRLIQEQPIVDLQKLAETLILDRFGPPGVVVNGQLGILQFIGHTGPYLEPTPGAASLNLIKLAHPDLTAGLRLTTHKAIRDQAVASKNGIRVHYKDRVEDVTLDVLPMPNEVHPAEPYYLVLFRKMAVYAVDEDKKAVVAARNKHNPDEADEQIRDLQQELVRSRNYVQSVIDDHEIATEEFQSAKEESQSSNEELQSTNEELETAKEELQSTNEEIITVNEQLEKRNAELCVLNDDLNNLLSILELPLIILDDQLRIRFFSAQAPMLLNLIDSDVGRPVGDIRTSLGMVDIAEHASKVMASLVPVTIELCADQDSRWYAMRIRPYRAQENRIKGVVIVFVDIHDNKILQQYRRLETLVEASNDAVTEFDFDGRIISWSPRAVEVYGYTHQQAVEGGINIIIPQDQLQLMQDAAVAIRAGKPVRPFLAQRLHSSGERVDVLITMSVVTDAEGRPQGIATSDRVFYDSCSES